MEFKRPSDGSEHREEEKIPAFQTETQVKSERTLILCIYKTSWDYVIRPLLPFLPLCQWQPHFKVALFLPDDELIDNILSEKSTFYLITLSQTPVKSANNK